MTSRRTCSAKFGRGPAFRKALPVDDRNITAALLCYFTQQGWNVTWRQNGSIHFNIVCQAHVQGLTESLQDAAR